MTTGRPVAVWTRDLIDAALASHGTYYLPYQVIATPGHKFRNRLLDAYYSNGAGHAVP